MLGAILGAAEGPALGTYYDTYLGSLEGFTNGTADVKFDSLLLRAGLRVVDGLQLGTVEVT